MSEWQNIETAPKDGTVILLYRESFLDWARIVTGEWDTDKYASKPKPRWTHHRENLTGAIEGRRYQPTKWQPLPEPPK